MKLTDAEIIKLMDEGYSDQEIRNYLTKPEPAAPTLLEKAKAALPVIGDEALKLLPGLGATGGGIVGAPAGPLGVVGGAAGGGVIGKSIEDFIRMQILGQPKTTTEQILGPLNAGVEQGTWEMAMPVLGKIAAPFATKLAANPRAQIVDQAVKKRNLPISPNSYNPTPASRFAEMTADWSPTGRLEEFRQGGKLEKGIMNWADELMEAHRATPAQTRAAYQLIESEAGGAGATLPMGKTYEAIDAMIDGVKDKNLKASMEKMLQAGRTPTFKDFDDFQKKIWSGGYSKTGMEKKDIEARGKLLNAIKEDLGGIEGQSGKASLDELFEQAKGASKNERAFKIVKTMIDKSIRPGEGLTSQFNPTTFLANFNKYEAKLAKDFPDIYDNLKTFATVVQAATRDIGKLRGDKHMSLKQALAATGGLLFGGGAVSGGTGAAVAVPLGFSWAMSKSMLNPKGWMRDWLTSGIKFDPRTVEGLRLGGKLAISKEQD
jgi:hypothetical protein